MSMKLELLAPARNREIGVAAIDCGADAVYIAGPCFGAREAAGNPLSEIQSLVDYAHRFRARVYLTVNTILFDDELEAARKLAFEAQEIGCDALIVQDFALSPRALPLEIPVFASTQANIRTAERAQLLESLGFSRLILARELSLEQIASIRRAVSCELEAFVHGALCVSYSGQCYLSEHLTGRSANRGCCTQPCRSRYDLEDADGAILLEDENLLFLKDLRRDGHIGALVDAGVTSFKIEGRLKNASYVKNVVRAYRDVVDAAIAERRRSDDASYEKASLGECLGGFSPDPNLTFTRGYTDYFIEGVRGRWRAVEAAGFLGECVGSVEGAPRRQGLSMSVRCRLREQSSAREGYPIANGDGLVFAAPSGETAGMRADVVRAASGRGEADAGFVEISVKWDGRVEAGSTVYRNHNIAFERELASNMPVRRIFAEVEVACGGGKIEIRGRVGGAGSAAIIAPDEFERAKDRRKMEETILRQLGKAAGPFAFEVTKIAEGPLPFVPLSALNALRRDLGAKLERELVEGFERGRKKARGERREIPGVGISAVERTYLANCANGAARAVYAELGSARVAPAYESCKVAGAELMRTKYCLKYELGWCPLDHPDFAPKEPLYLSNNGNRMRLSFDCAACEMILTDSKGPRE